MGSELYSGRGDDGSTGLLGEGRVSKSDARIEALGSLDEASAVLGLARSICRSEEVARYLLHTQRDLYNLMVEVAATPATAGKFSRMEEERLSWLESAIEHIGGKVNMPREFIVPGDTQSAATLDVARTVVRRAERRLVTLYEQGEIDNPVVLQYMNRLSSFCFVLELYENQLAGRDRPTLAKSV